MNPGCSFDHFSCQHKVIRDFRSRLPNLRNKWPCFPGSPLKAVPLSMISITGQAKHAKGWFCSSAAWEMMSAILPFFPYVLVSKSVVLFLACLWLERHLRVIRMKVPEGRGCHGPNPRPHTHLLAVITTSTTMALGTSDHYCSEERTVFFKTALIQGCSGLGYVGLDSLRLR